MFDSSIEFRGDNSIVYICETKDVITLNLKVYNNSVFYMRYENYTNKGIKIVVSEQTNVIFGNDNLISYNTCIRTADSHIIYDSFSHKRINPSKGVYIGDHVWIGQHVLFLKDDCHRFLDEDIEKYSICENNDYIFERDDITLSFDDIEYKLNHSTFDEKMDILNEISLFKDKNRFFI